MGYALKKIQTVETSVTYLLEELDDVLLLDVVASLDLYKDIALVGTIQISEFDLVLVNHLEGKAVGWHRGISQVIDYALMDESIIRGNHYLVYISGTPTLILNCDPLLGDAFERAIVLSYQYRLASMTKLNPSEITYFQSADEDSRIRYDRYQMIESLKKAYIDNTDLTTFNYHYRQWIEDQGEQYLQVVEYDYYDGLKAYIAYKVKVLHQPDYDLNAYIESQKNSYGFYSKSKEYELMGLLWFLMAERNEIEMFEEDDVRSDRYRILLDGTPYTPMIDSEEYQAFVIDYANYNIELTKLTEEQKNKTQGFHPIILDLWSETYEDTIQIDKDLYLYTDFRARNRNMSIIEAKEMLVRVSSYKIEYYIEKDE